MAGIRPSEVASHQTVRLAAGKHAAPGAEVCVMELASMLARERFSDRPQSVCPVIGAILRTYNDWIGDDLRNDMYRYAAELVGTRGDYALQQRRAKAAIAWARTLRPPRGRWGRVLIGERCEPESDAGPEEIARHVVRAVRRATRGRPAAKLRAVHESLLGLVDALIELGNEAADLFVGDLVEHQCEPVEHAGRGGQLAVAELR